MLTFAVHGNAAPQGSARAIVSQSTGKPMLKKDNEKSQNAWRRNVRDEVRRVMDGRPPLDGPVVLAITVTRPKPVSAPKRKPSWPWKKPDWDKLARAICDGLKDGGAYKDDAQVVSAMVTKAYAIPGPFTLDPANGAAHMLGLWTTYADVMNTPGAVIRLAHLTEFPGIRDQLADAGYKPEDIPGGRR